MYDVLNASPIYVAGIVNLEFQQKKDAGTAREKECPREV